MASGWNLWVWLKCIGVVSECFCKEVYRFPHIISYPYSTCITSFFCSSIPTNLFIFKMFFRSFYSTDESTEVEILSTVKIIIIIIVLQILL